MFNLLRSIGVVIILICLYEYCKIYIYSVLDGDASFPLNSLVLFCYLIIFFIQKKNIWYFGIIYSFLYFLSLAFFELFDGDYRLRLSFTYPIYYTIAQEPLKTAKEILLIIPVIYSFLFFISFFTKEAKEFYGIKTL
jgi:hypothetical protein